LFCQARWSRDSQAARTWTLVSEYIRTAFGVEYRKSQIYNIFALHWFEFSKGKVFFPEAEDREEAVSVIKNFRAKCRQRNTV
jgi:hypothetical protein